jgi:ferric-dicitrate binding protein FerR (iron transport regulator)
MENFNPNLNNSYKVDSTPPSIEAKILEQAALLSVPQGLSKEEAFQRLMQKIESGQTSEKIVKPRFGYWAIGLAASLLVLLGVYWASTRDVMETVLAGNAQQKVINLPDGSRVSLNAGSEIAFAKNNFTKKRELSLNGEAFFEVKKGSHFQINTPNGKVEILGTSLDVVSRNQDFKVTCITGKVKVSCQENSQIILPGESAVKQNNGLIKSKEEEAAKLTAWRSGEFHYRNTQLIAIFAEIERQFNVSIQGVYDASRPYTGGFSNKNIEEALDNVCIPMGLRYEINKDKVVIKGTNQ